MKTQSADNRVKKNPEILRHCDLRGVFSLCRISDAGRLYATKTVDSIHLFVYTYAIGFDFFKS